ncbi:MAG: MFS transporter [Defluviitaleaceae bacterium]|nr:MFS transporter [Defluviitaleaceae bacterium]
MKKNPLVLMIAVYSIFFALGMPDGAFGVAWPRIRYEMGLELGQATVLIVVHSIFYSLSSSQTGRLARFIRVERLGGIGFLLLLVGVLCFSFAPNLMGLTGATVLLGLGMGLVDSGVNAFAADRFSARHLNWLHCFWGMGGAVSPVIMRQMVMFYDDWRVGYQALFVIQLVIAVFVAFSIFKGYWDLKTARQDGDENISPSQEGAFLTSKVYPVVQWWLFFLYTAFEYSVTFWTVSVLIESEYRNVPFETAGLFPAIYLGALMAGRFIFGYVTDLISGVHVIRIGFALSLVGLVILTFSSSFVGIALVGFGFAPVFPCLMNETKTRFHPASLSKLVGLQIAAAGLGVALSAIVMREVLAISLELLYPTVIACVVVAFSMNEFIQWGVRRRHSRVSPKT